MARLGLSATPERAGDPDGTRALLEYFGGIVDTFTLQDALDADPPILTKYAYEPRVVGLSDDEQDEWDELSNQIGALIARHAGNEELPHQALQHSDVKRLLIQRARVIKKARAKTPLARSVVSEHYEAGQRWLVYCEDQDQLRVVVDELLDADLPVTEYHSAMTGNRAATLNNFAANGGVIVSIRCLDEGVDIPVATHALILASSRNPREFIQRRGRVLRKAPGQGVRRDLRRDRGAQTPARAQRAIHDSWRTRSRGRVRQQRLHQGGSRRAGPGVRRRRRQPRRPGCLWRIRGRRRLARAPLRAHATRMLL